MSCLSTFRLCTLSLISTALIEECLRVSDASLDDLKLKLMCIISCMYV